MDYLFLVGGIAIASLVGFALLHRRTSTRTIARTSTKFSAIDESLKTSQNVVCQSEEAMPETEIIIVGAGVAGSALAYALGKDGRRVRVIERDLSEPDRIVGELLQPGGYLKLMELSLEDCVEGIDAQRVFGYALYKDGKSTRLSYPLQSLPQDVAGRSFHNGRFIQRMRAKAATLPDVKLEQGTVTSLVEVKGTIKGVQYKTKAGQDLTAFAPLTIVCDGCFSNLRRFLCNPQGTLKSKYKSRVNSILPPFESAEEQYHGISRHLNRRNNCVGRLMASRVSVGVAVYFWT